MMKSDQRYLPFFFLCWAVLFGPFALLNVLQNQRKEKAAKLTASDSVAVGYTQSRSQIFSTKKSKWDTDRRRCFIGFSLIHCYGEARSTKLYRLKENQQVELEDR